jgi:ribosomal protein L40E
MTETITESFCERCGTRYSFEAAAKPRRRGLGRVRVLTRGMATYVSNDGMPLSEAMAAARDDEARAGISHQLDEFHKTFNFCMSCRQYTCPNCWNEAAGECLTCAPDLSREILPPAFPDLPAAGPIADGNGLLEHEAIEATAWPHVDLHRGELQAEAAAGAETAAATDADLVAGPETAPPVVDAVATPPGAEAPAAAPADAEVVAVAPEAPVHAPAPETLPIATGSGELTAAELAEIESALASTPIAPPAAPDAPVAVAADAAEPQRPAAEVEPAATAAGDEVEPAAALPAEPEVEPAAAPPADLEAARPTDTATAARSQTRRLLGRFRPGRGDEAPALGRSAATPAEPEPVSAPEPEPQAAVATPEHAAAAQPEPAVTAAEPAVPEAEPVAAEPVAAEPEPAAAAAEPAPEPVPEDTIEQPTWRTVAPDAPETPAPTWPDAPAWPPVSPQSRQPGPDAGRWASRLAISRPDPEPTSVWAASSEELLAAAPAAAGAAPAVQACVSCGLSLSANARFCRRCGTRQV